MWAGVSSSYNLPRNRQSTGENMTGFQWAGTFLAIWGAAGPLIGVWFGQRLARENQRLQWLADSKKQEYKEVLKMMGEVSSVYVQYYLPNQKSKPVSGMNVHEATRKMISSIDGCVFIREEIRAETNKFTDLLQLISDQKSDQSFDPWPAYHEIRNAIISLARKSF